MTDRPPPPARVRVTSPHTVRGPRARRTAAAEIDAQSRLGEVYMRSLLRAQLRLALAVLGVLALGVGVLPLVFWLAPTASAQEVLGMPVAWVLLGFGVYPVLVLLGWAYVRAAERNEAAFADVLREPPTTRPADTTGGPGRR